MPILTMLSQVVNLKEAREFFSNSKYIYVFKVIYLLKSSPNANAVHSSSRNFVEGCYVWNYHLDLFAAFIGIWLEVAIECSELPIWTCACVCVSSNALVCIHILFQLFWKLRMLSVSSKHFQFFLTKIKYVVVRSMLMANDTWWL